MLSYSSTSSHYLLQNFHLGIANEWSLRSFGRSRACLSDQEKSTGKPGKKQDKGTRIVYTKSVTKEDNLLIPHPPIGQQDSPPPIVSALKALAEQDVANFQFPGHNRGRAAPSSLSQLIGLRPFLHDIFTLPGHVLDAQTLAAKLFGSSETWFLVGGTTCGIQAAIMATCSPGEFLILPRNSHVSAISAMVLSGVQPKYIIPEYDFEWDVAGAVTPSQVEQAIKELEVEGQKAAAVFITSPTYQGICSNLSKISQLCHSRGIPLIVDEAHGAHLGFHPQLPRSALQQGADLVIQSTHKVLCSLTQSSMLHMSGNIVDKERISRCLRILQRTSPSSLLLASLDATRAQLSENSDTIFNKPMELAFAAKKLIKRIPGVSVLDFPSFSNFPAIDPWRLTIGFWKLGLSSYEAEEILWRDHGIASELVGTRYITYVMNLGTSEDHIQRLVLGLNHLMETSANIHGDEEGRVEHSDSTVPFADIKMSLIPRDAFFASQRKVDIGESLGEVCGELICPFPPGIPAMIPGEDREVITEKALDYLLDVRSKGAIISGASDPLLSSILVCNL